MVLTPLSGGQMIGNFTIEWKLYDTHWLNWSVSYCWPSVLVGSAQSSPCPSTSPHSPLGWVTTHTQTHKIEQWHHYKYNSGSDYTFGERLVYLEVVVVGQMFFICVSRQRQRIRWGYESWMLWVCRQTTWVESVFTCGNVLKHTEHQWRERFQLWPNEARQRWNVPLKLISAIY